MVIVRIVFITAGAAGMYCGSCMRDNALAAALVEQGHDALLVPTYTPIRTDDADVSNKRVFFGGINVYLQQKAWFFRHTPRFLDHLLDANGLLRWVSKFAANTPYSELGALTISMLRGDHGHQRKELAKLVDWLKSEIQPDVILLTNVLLSGLVPELKRHLGVPILATLQGDDIFLDCLPAADKATCLDLIRVNCADLAGLIATSRYYADHMSGYLGIPRDRIAVIPAGISLKGHGGPAIRRDDPRPVIGFFARIAPEKGFDQLVDAFIALRKTTSAPVLRASGWLGEQHRGYLQEQEQKLAAAGLASEFEYVASPTHADKARFYQGIDLLCMPTRYREPKGLYALEAWANGVPVLLPAHGCFPELVAATGGGRLYPPEDPAALVDALRTAIADGAAFRTLGETARGVVAEKFSAAAMARATVAHLQTQLA